MSERLPALTARQMISVLMRRGFALVRQSGSHAILRRLDGRRVTVPIHSGRDLGRGLTRKIMRDAELTMDDLK